MSVIGREVRRFLSTTEKREDLYFLDLGGIFLQVWHQGWRELAKIPGKFLELDLPPFAAGQTIVRLRAYDYPENGSVVSFANGAALQVFFYPFTDDDGHVSTVYAFYDPQRAAERLEPGLAELDDPIVREEPHPASH